MLNVYFTASTSFNGEFTEKNTRIIRLLKNHHINLVSGEQIINKKLLEQDKKLSREQIFQRQKELIEKSDFVVAEVSKPSLGVGGEIVYALISNKPVLALLMENFEDKISPMVAGNPSDNLFMEYYSSEKLPYVLNDFFNHIRNIKKRTGSIIVIDGGNGSGKTTQAKLLVDYLKKNKVPTKLVDFPQYYNSFHGKIVARFLRGEFGSINDVSPYLASLAYALDRASIKREMEDFLKNGGYIVANRYTTSSMAHQGAKFKDKEEQQKFLKWIYDLEYKVHKIPKENIVIYLYVPWQLGMKLTEKKDTRQYLNGKDKDIEEADIQNRINSEKMYLYLAKKYHHWVTIDCTKDQKILPPELIHQKIVQVLKEKKLL
jgi:dTMP kinase